MVVDDEERAVDDGGGEAAAVRPPDVPIVEMQAARAEDLRREVELRLPVVDGGTPQEALRPAVHLCGHVFGHVHEHRVAVDRELEIALVVQRHRGDLAEGVFAVEHPAVGARQQRVGDVADAGIERCAGLGGRAGALNPLAAKVARNLAPDERAVARLLDGEGRAWNRRLRIEEGNRLALPGARGAPLDAPGHDGLPVCVERGEGLEGHDHLGGQHIGIYPLEVAADFESA